MKSPTSINYSIVRYIITQAMAAKHILEADGWVVIIT